MFQLNKKNIVIIGVVGAVVLGGIYLYFSGKLTKPTGGTGEEVAQEEIFSIAGKVISVDTADNSFVVLQPQEEREFTVKLGEETEFIRLIFPFDINNPPVDATFTPEREAVTIEDLEVDDQVFVRGSSPIKTEQDIVNPLEVQVLP